MMWLVYNVGFVDLSLKLGSKAANPIPHLLYRVCSQVSCDIYESAIVIFRTSLKKMHAFVIFGVHWNVHSPSYAIRELGLK